MPLYLPSYRQLSAKRATKRQTEVVLVPCTARKLPAYRPSHRRALPHRLPLFDHGAQFQPQMVAWRVAEILLHAQVTLRGLDRSVAQRYLDLLDRGLALVRQFRIRPTQVMGGEVRESQRGRVLAQDPPINDPVGQAK
jgi:hypothetical protein